VNRRNPWIVLLWVIGSVLVVGATALQIWTASFYFGAVPSETNDPAQRFLRQLAEIVALPGVMVGFATIAGLLFLHAWRHSHSTVSRR
jgi:hypothetical protein